MTAKDFESLIAYSKTPNNVDLGSLTIIIKDNFKLETLLTLGAAFQILLLAILPQRIALLPTGLLLLLSIAKTLTQLLLNRNDFMAKTLPGRATAQLPDAGTGKHGAQAAAKPLVVLHLGIRYNHPLGLLAPGAMKAADYFQKLNAELSANPDEHGLLGMNMWQAADRGSNNTMMGIFYFKDVESLNKFAHGPLHRRAWQWVEKAGHKHLGIFHETFSVPAGGYEGIYVDMHPTLMGAARVKADAQDSEGGEKWLSPLVSANHPTLRSQYGRMGKSAKSSSLA